MPMGGRVRIPVRHRGRAHRRLGLGSLLSADSSGMKRWQTVLIVLIFVASGFAACTSEPEPKVKGASIVNLTSGDVTNLKTIRRKAQSIITVVGSLSASVPAADKTAFKADAQAIVDRVNALLTPSPTTPPPTTPPPSGEVTVTAAGDIAGGDGSGAEPTGDLVRALNPDLVLTLGDAAQHSGTLSDYQTYYDPHWGSFKSKTFPTPGNHDYQVSATAEGYRTYFGVTDTTQERFLGDWIIVSVNSIKNIDASMNLLMSILETDDHQCELVTWHRPRWSSGTSHGSEPAVQPLWQVLADNGVEVLLSGHDHDYERFSPKNATGGNVTTGTRQFVVGMGGSGTDSFGTIESGSQVRITGTSNHGVLELTLNPTSYDWRFVRASDQQVLDSGTTPCN